MRQQLRVMLLVVCASASAFAESAFAQSGLGSVTATIVDETGGRLSGAALRLVECPPAPHEARTATKPA